MRGLIAFVAVGVLLALGAATVSAGSCSTISSCGAAGATCGQISNTTSYNYCEANSLCMASTPGSSSYVCVSGSLIKGRSCNTDSDCSSKGFTLGGLQTQSFSRCSNGVCSNPQLVPNDYCSTSSECRSNNCNSNGRCAGNSTSLACGSTNDCEAGNICRSGICQLQVSTGGNCTLSSSFCKANDGCGFNDVCVRDYTVAAGAACQSDSNCGEDLTCSGSACALNSATVGATCNTNGDCGNGACSCNYVSGTQYCSSDVNRCTVPSLSYTDCVNGANCHSSSSPLAENSCARRNCFGQYYSYIECVNSGYNRTAFPGACFAGLASPASTVESSIFSLLF